MPLRRRLLIWVHAQASPHRSNRRPASVTKNNPVRLLPSKSISARWNYSFHLVFFCAEKNGNTQGFFLDSGKTPHHHRDTTKETKCQQVKEAQVTSLRHWSMCRSPVWDNSSKGGSCPLSCFSFSLTVPTPSGFCSSLSSSAEWCTCGPFSTPLCGNLKGRELFSNQRDASTCGRSE